MTIGADGLNGAPQPGRSIAQIATSSGRELLRNGFSAGVMFFMFLSLIVILGMLDLLLQNSMAGGESLLRQNLGVIPAMGFISLAFVGTSVPLVTYRERGTLRLLGTTPLSKRSFLIGQLPVRAAIATAESVVVLALMRVTGTHSPPTLAVAAVTLLFGAAMFLAIGVLVGSRGRNADLVMQISLIAPIVVIATSGVLFPLGALPEWLSAGTAVLPTTWFIAAIDSAATMPFTTLLASWIGLLAVAIAALCIAVRIFDWGAENDPDS